MGKMHIQRKLIDKSELMGGKTGLFPKILAGSVMSIFGLNRANRIYSDTYDSENYTTSLLDAVQVSYTVSPQDLDNIPATGPLIVICNHPTGAVDGIALIDVLAKIRPDVKFMGNFLLDRIEPLRKNIIPVDPFDSRNRARNVKGLRESLAHLKEGGLLAIFPAGEIATWQDGFSGIRDKEWDSAVIKFIRKANLPVLPMFMEARNSVLFRLAGKLHPSLRTVLIPREYYNKKGKVFKIIAGTVIQPKRLEGLDDDNYAKYLRACVDYLKGSRDQRSRGFNAGVNEDEVMKGILPRPEVEIMKSELKAIEDKYLMFHHNEYSLYCAPYSAIPNIMVELGRMREITFRTVGEGTRKEADLDQYDEYYHHLFLWDNTENMIVGAYRIGFGDEIISKLGISGFYTNSLFEYDDALKPVLERTMELGRSFISREYQKKPTPLMLLWKGLVYVLLKYTQFRYMLGPVTISGEFSDASKMIIFTYLKEHKFNDKLASFVRPVTGMKGIDAEIDLSLIKDIDSMDLIGRLVADIEQEERVVPVLVKKYLGLSSSVLGFNVDREFCNALDALMLLDMKNVPESSILMLSKEITEIDVVARFKVFH